MPEAAENEKVVVKMLVKEELVGRMYDALPNIKLLLVVKNPITRMVSHIMHEYKNPGGLFEGSDMPVIDDIIMGRVHLSLPDIGTSTEFNFWF